MRRFFVLFYLLVSSLHLLAQDTTFTHYDTLRGSLTHYRNYDVYFYDLNLTVQPAEKSINGFNTIYFTASQLLDTIQIDLFKNLSIDSIIFQKSRLSFTRDSNATFIKLATSIPQGKKEKVTVYYHGKPTIAIQPPWQGGFVWEKDTLGRPWIGVACEGLGASVWWPCKDYLADEPDSMRMTFIVPSKIICISNGNLLKTEKVNATQTSYQWFVHYPINNYDVTFNAAHYTHFLDTLIQGNHKPLALDYYVLDYNKEKAEEHFEKQVKPILRCYEKLFGLYPFQKDGYALVETHYWGMEHQSCIAYGNNYNSEIFGIDYIIMHETAHEWWGNSVSTKDHGQLWIQESFATYSEPLLLECMYSYDIALKYLLYIRRNIQNKEPVEGPLNVNYNGWKDSDMYYKGAWMLHSLRNSINNDKLWFKIIYGLATHFRLSSVSSDDIINYISKEVGKDLKPFFNEYLHYTNPPVFYYELTKGKKNNYTLKYKWKANASGFTMPMVIYTDGKKSVRLNPTSQLQSYSFTSENIQDFKVATELFYVTVETPR